MDFGKLYELGEKNTGYYGKRLFAQLEYGAELSAAADGIYDAVLSEILDGAYTAYKKEGAVTKRALADAEKKMQVLSPTAKSLEVLCVAHAHIDMNWMWAFDETVAITLATFRTMLDLMKEYKDFRFSQSQASVYKIVEEYSPEMLTEIKKRIKEGRWEVSASTWVENDKNMPNGESQVRHILYTKQYLSKLLDIDPDTLNLDFEPDTFGHNVNIPEILSSGGVKYYYHCRGNEASAIYRWSAPSGKSILVYREPTWYNWMIGAGDFRHVPDFAKRYNLKKVLKVYGVGDHGGGATRRDIETFIDMNKWPLMPTFKFSSYGEFFAYLEASEPVVAELTGEQNYVFSGCYTSQSRIKQSNHNGEKNFFETEGLAAYASALGLTAPRTGKTAEAWQKHLFSHFHDIITGSGVIGTREYALAMAQQRDAFLGAEKTAHLSALAANIDTSVFKIKEDLSSSLSEGAGVGFQMGENVYTGHAGAGNTRLFLLYNPGACGGKTVARITLWDHEGSPEDYVITDAAGNPVRFEVLGTQAQHYWGHMFRRIDVSVDIPAFGYMVISLKCVREEKKEMTYPPIAERCFRPDNFILENEFIRARFDSDNGALVSLFDKEQKAELINGQGGCFRFIKEDASKGMTAWVQGRRREITPLLKDIRILDGLYRPDGLTKTFYYEADFGTSALRVTYSLKEGAKFLTMDAECDLHDFGDSKSIPALDYYLPLNSPKAYRYDVPMGVLERPGTDADQCANSFAYAETEKSGAMLISEGKYGFRCSDGAVAVSLLRATTDPDPIPENCRHRFRIGISALPYGGNAGLIARAAEFKFGVTHMSIAPKKGALPLTGRFFTLSGNVTVSAVKPAEDGKGIIVRLYEADGRDAEFGLEFCREIASAVVCDSLERITATADFSGGKIKGSVPKNSVMSLRVCFKAGKGE